MNFFSRMLILIIIYSLLTINLNLFAQEKLAFSLEQYIRLALERNETVRQAQESLRRAEANLRAVRSDKYPHLDLNSLLWRREDPGISYNDSKDYLLSASLSQLLWRFGERPDFLDKAYEDLRLALIQYEGVKKDAAYKVREVFYNILLAQEEIDERRKLEAAIQQKLSRVRERQKAGILLRINVLNTELELSEQQREINKLERSLELGKIELLQLIGGNELRLKDVEIIGSRGERPFAPTTEYTLDEAVKLALNNRLDLQLLAGDIERQKRLVKEAEWNRLPQLRAFARYKNTDLTIKQQNRTWDTIFSHELPILEKESERVDINQGIGTTFPSDFNALESRSRREGWEARFNFDFPIFDGFSTKELKRVEQAELNRLLFKKRELEKAITLEVQRAYRDVATAKERVEIEQKVVEIRRENLRLIEALLETAQESEQYRSLTFDDVITARAAFTEAQRIYFQARREYAKAKETLLRAIGVIE